MSLTTRKGVRDIFIFDLLSLQLLLVNKLHLQHDLFNLKLTPPSHFAQTTERICPYLAQQ